MFCMCMFCVTQLAHRREPWAVRPVRWPGPGRDHGFERPSSANGPEAQQVRFRVQVWGWV